MFRYAFSGWLRLGLAGSVLLTACSSGEAGYSGPACEPGTARTCECDDGRIGSRLCLAASGEYARCLCDDVHGARNRDAGSDDVPTSSSATPDRPRKNDAGTSAGTSAGMASAADGGMAAPPSGGSPTVSGRTPLSDAGESGAADAAADGGVGPAEVDASAGQASAGLGVLAEPQDEAVYLFDQAQLRTYDIRVDPADLASIDQQPSAETWINATLMFEGQAYGPYMFRYKGSEAAFGGPCTTNGRDTAKAEKCSFKLGFDEVDKETRFYGLRKLNFHAMNLDKSLMRERLGYSLFRAHGVAASRAVHVRVLINGVLDGLYIAVEQIDGRFTRARFDDGGEGNLYKEVWPVYDDPQEYLAKLETNEDENPSVQIMLDLKAAIASSNQATEAIIKRDYTARYIAVDRVIMNDDGSFHFYCSPERPENAPKNHNFYWYEAMAGDRLWIVPWDLDNSFDSARWSHVSPEWNVSAACECNPVADAFQAPPMCDPLVAEFAEWTPQYEAEVDAFLAGPYAKAAVDAKLRAWTEQIRPVVAEVNGLHAQPTEAEWATALSEFESKVETARQNRGYPY